MIKCDNCNNQAAYTCADPGVNPVNYCTDCLPVWLQQRASAGHFPLVQAVVEPAPIVEEPVIDENPSEETTAPKSKKKKAATSDENNN